MGFNNDALVTFFKPWFDGTPVNAAKSSGTLTFTDVVVEAETVTIGADVYEFVADAGDIAVATNIPVVVGVTLTADNAVAELADAINANTTELVSAIADTDDDTVVITHDFVGTEGNSIGIETDCTNAGFGDGVTTLSGGLYATPCKASSALIEISGTKYYTTKPVDKFSETGWNSIALTEL